MSEAQKPGAVPRQDPIAQAPALTISDTQESLKGGPDTSQRTWLSFFRSAPVVGHTHQGFGESKKADVPEPQSTPVLVFGEVSAPHPVNCKHQGPGEPDQEQTDNEEPGQEEPDGIVSPKTVVQKDVETHSLLDKESTTVAQEKASSEPAEERVNSSEDLSHVTALALSAPDILVWPPPEVSGSLGTRAILGTADNSPKMVNFWGTGSSKSPLPAPGEDGGALPKSLPAAESLPGGPPAGGLPKAELPPTDLPSLPAVPLDVPAVPALPTGLPGGGGKPHAKKRVRRKLKQKAQPQVAKVRKLILKKKTLSKLLGKELTSILEPHLNAATSGVGGDGPPVPAPIPP